MFLNLYRLPIFYGTQAKFLSWTLRAFHMLALNYLFRLISTTCSNSNNPSTPQEPTICWSCHSFTILTPTFLLTKLKGMGNHQLSFVHTLGSPDPLSRYHSHQAEGMLWWPGRVLQSQRPPVQYPSQGHLLLRARSWVSPWDLSLANGSHFTKVMPYPWRHPTSTDWSLRGA